MTTNRVKISSLYSTLSLTPPTGRTSPLRVISPVMAVSARTQRFPNRDTKAVTNVTPADGPSFGTAPAGKWICMSRSLRRLPASATANFSSAALARTYSNANSLLIYIQSQTQTFKLGLLRAEGYMVNSFLQPSQASKPETVEHLFREFKSSPRSEQFVLIL
jgi:hypothetical protein